MVQSNTSVLVGGTFLTLLIEARMPPTKRKERTKGKADAFNESDILLALVKIVQPDFYEGSGASFKTYTNAYKNCRQVGLEDLKFDNEYVVNGFNKRIENNYFDVLHAMAEFTNRFLECGTTKGIDIQLVKRLLELIRNDKDANVHAFTTDKNGTKKTGTALFEETHFYLPAFLLSIWHFIVSTGRDNELGTDTISAWFPDKKEAKAAGKFKGIDGKSITQEITVEFSLFELPSEEQRNTDTHMEIAEELSIMPQYFKHDVDENELVEEVERKCRIHSCGMVIRYYDAGQTRRHFEIIKVPNAKNLPAVGNPTNRGFIALCQEHAKTYENAIGEMADELFRIKSQWLMRWDAKNRLLRIDLGTEIRDLLTRFDTARRGAKKEPDFTLVKTEEKIVDTNSALFEEINDHVALHFNLITDVINQLDRELGVFSSKSLRAQVENAFYSFDRADFTQEEVFSQLADWLRDQTDSTDSTVCRIVISYYVRTCAVFEPIKTEMGVSDEPSK